jgi:thioredoxin reductase
MRASPREAAATGTIRYDGRAIEAVEGETIAAAIIASGEQRFRRTRDGGRRGVFCGMGVCQECLVVVDGRHGQRACMTKLRAGMVIEPQDYAPAPLTPASAPNLAAPRASETPDVLIVGGGAAGLSAGIAAAGASASVTLIDERPEPGGQFYKQLSALYSSAHADRQMRDGADLITQARAAGVAILSDATVWGAFGPREIAVEHGGITRLFAPRALILATGAYERAHPVPGWTLPGVMTTGAAQTLLRSYRVCAGKRVLIAGNGPLNLQVAAELVAAGATVVAVAEAAPAPRASIALATMALTAPDLMRDGLRYRAALRGADTPLLYEHALVRVEGGERAERAVLAPIDRAGRPVAGGERSFEVDAVCMGYGFEPQNELARALGCRAEWDTRRDHLVIVRDDDMQTTAPCVYVAGDGGGLNGARAARAQGAIAGFAAARATGRDAGDEIALAAARRDLRRALRFQDALWRVFKAPALSMTLASGDTTICRCEGVPRADLDAAAAVHGAAIGAIKRDTRAGMGHCQGRYCGPVLARALGSPEEFALFAPRAPGKPVKLAAIARAEEA